jgi:GxxExxY protein
MDSRKLFISVVLPLNWITLEFCLEERSSSQFFYKEHDVGTRRADFIIENKIVVEIKAVISLDDVHLAQAKNYLVAYNFDIGLLINFGSPSLEYKRIYHSRLRKNNVNSVDR